MIHSYEDIGTYDIKVDAKLAGEFRVNGGAWQDINTVADLQDEPVAELEVLQARNRLVQEQRKTASFSGERHKEADG